MDYTRILAALSLSHGRDAAFDRALSLAQVSGADLYLLHAVPADYPFSYRAAERLQRLARFRERAAAAGVNVQTIQQHGDPAEIIVLHGNALSVDLIVMGTGRRTGWAQFRKASVGERVIHLTERPALVVRDDTHPDAAFENVLVAVDLAPGATQVIDAAVRLAGSDVRRLTVLHALDSIEAASAVRHPARWLVPEYRGHVLDDARRRLQAMLPAGIDRDIAVELRVVPGPVAETIGKQAAALDAHLIVVARTRRFTRLGSNTLRVLRRGDRTLLVLPPSASAETTEVRPPQMRAA